MDDNKQTEEYLYHCMLFHFRSSFNAAIAIKTICHVYSDVLKVNKCQRWFRKFSNNDFDLSDNDRSGRPVEFDNDALKALVETDPKISIHEIANTLQAT